MEKQTVQEYINGIIELIYEYDSMTRKEYIHCKDILNDPNFNNLSVHKINTILGPIKDMATGEMVPHF